MKQNGLWVIAFVIVALMVLTSVSPLSMNRTEEIDNSTYIIGDTPPDNPELGDLWFDTTLDEMNIYNGYVWQSLVPTVSGAGYSDHAAKHYWGGVDPISFQELSPEIRVASEFATSGTGTSADPWINGIEEAIDDISERGEVYMPAGVFEIDTKITLPAAKTITLRGAGHGIVNGGRGTKIKQKDGTNLSIIMNIVGHDSTLSDFYLDGNKDNNGGAGVGIRFNGRDGSMENVGVLYCHGHGIQVYQDYIQLRHVLSEFNGGSGFYMLGAENTHFDHCISYDNDNVGFYLVQNYNNLVFTACRAMLDNGYGFRLLNIGAPYSNSFIGCTVVGDDNAEHAFLIEGVPRNRFIGCNVYNAGRKTHNTYDAFHLTSTGALHTTHNLFQSCTIYSDHANKTRYGINEVDANQDHNSYVGNIIEGCASGKMNINGKHNKIV